MRKLLPVLLLAGSFGPGLRDAMPQESREKRQIAEEQDRQRRRLERLRQTIASLQPRVEKEGRSRAAELLQQASEKLEQLRLDQAMAELSVSIEEGRALQSLERQETLVRDLEELVSILLDRKDLEKIEEDLKDAAAMSKAIQELRQEQQSILDQTRQINEASKSPGEKALQQEIEKAIAQQQELLQKTEKLSQGGLQSLWEAKEDLQRLLDRQKKAMEGIRQLGEESSDPAQEEQIRKEAGQLSLASKRANLAAKNAAQAQRNAQEGSLSDNEKKAALEEIAKHLEKESQATQTPGLEEIAKAIRKEDLAEAAKQAQQMEAEASRAAQRASALDARDKLVQEEREIRRQVERLARSLQANKEISNGEEVVNPLWKASESLSKAAESLGSSQKSQAGENAARAQESMQKAAESLEKAIDTAGAQTLPQIQALAEQQAALEQAVEKLAEDEIPERLRKQELTPKQAEKSQPPLEQARDAMERARKSMEQGRPTQAAGAQREALERMRSAQKGLAEGRENPADKKSETQELARRQKELEKQILELAKRMEEAKKPSASKSLGSAAEKASQAGENLDRGETGEAEPKEEEAQKYLDQARNEVEKEKQKYLKLRQEELLFRIGEELRNLIQSHEEAMKATVEAETERIQANGTLGRTLKLKIQKIGKDEETLAGDCARIAEALENEQSEVFSYGLRACEEDLDRIGEWMGRDGGFRADEPVQGLQQDVAERLGWLLKALQEQIQNRSKAPSQPQQPQEGENRPEPRLVPDVAELKMLKKIEESLAARTEQLLRWQKQGIAEDSFLRIEIERLAHRHNRVTELFSSFKKRLGIE